MSQQEQQRLMDRQRALIQNEARAAAAGQTAANLPGGASSYTTPSREGSGTPLPNSAMQVNGQT
jgi:hypothetical protein